MSCFCPTPLEYRLYESRDPVLFRFCIPNYEIIAVVQLRDDGDLELGNNSGDDKTSS